ncbi:hypothetical protein ACFLZO_00335 [Patescibacteria group bacterium]
MTKQYPVVKEKAWSTVPAEQDTPRPRLLKFDDSSVHDLLSDHIDISEHSNIFTILIPPDAKTGPAAALGWGYTVIRDGDDLYAFQRIVFIPERMTPIAECATGKFITSTGYALSAW